MPGNIFLTSLVSCVSFSTRASSHPAQNKYESLKQHSHHSWHWSRLGDNLSLIIIWVTKKRFHVSRFVCHVVITLTSALKVGGSFIDVSPEGLGHQGDDSFWWAQGSVRARTESECYEAWRLLVQDPLQFSAIRMSKKRRGHEVQILLDIVTLSNLWKARKTDLNKQDMTSTRMSQTTVCVCVTNHIQAGYLGVMSWWVSNLHLTGTLTVTQRRRRSIES